jgi:hypothetical protein
MKVRPWGFKLTALLLSSLLALILAEMTLRLVFPSSFHQDDPARVLMYQYDPELGWFPKPNVYGRFSAIRTITLTNNSQGFREREPRPDSRPGIMFLGDSFTWGFDVTDSERFTNLLQAKHPEWNISNCGICGYGTDQEFLLLKRYFDRFKPRLVFLIFCADNDDEDNSSNIQPGGYYKPYYTAKDGRLTLHGIPVPRSERTFCSEHKILCRSCVMQLLIRACFKLTTPPPVHPQGPPQALTGALIREMQLYVNSKGASLAIGIQGSCPQLEDFLKHLSIPCVDLTTTSPSARFTDHGRHWTPEGHAYVCSKLDHFLPKANANGVNP